MDPVPNRLLEIFSQVQTKASPAERERFLAEACRGEPELRKQVEALLGASERAGDFLANTIKIQPPDLVTEGPGTVIGHYKLLQQIGEGGCGVVYMAEQEQPIRRRVAIKVIKLGMDTKQVIARFEAERQALALMDHPNIAKVLDAGATETGRPYFVMELVRGIRITDYCDQNNLSTEQRLDLFIQVCHAIQHAHQKGIIHRDIKPSNILVTINDGVPVPKVIDFGIAKATEQRLTDKTLFTAFEQFIGTPAYMSPEQAEMTSLDIDTRSDIYALGVLLYELLTGQTPFNAKELMAAGVEGMRRIIREQEPVRPSTCISTLIGADQTTVAKRRQSDPPKLVHQVRGDLDWIVMKCLEKDRTRRYETANGLAHDIGRHLNSEPVTARPPSRLYQFQKLVRRNRLAFTAAGAVTAAVIAGLAGIIWQWQRAVTNYSMLSIALAEIEAETERVVGQQNDPWPTNMVLYYSSAGDSRIRNNANDRFWQSPSGKRETRVERRAETNRSFTATNLIPPAKFITGNSISVAEQSCTVWDLTSGGALSPDLHHDSFITYVQFSPDERLLATACSDGTARVWDIQTGRLMTSLLRHAQPVNVIRFAPDGRRIATGSSDFTARVWDVRTGRPLVGPLMADNSPVVSIRFSRDGKHLITLTAQGIVAIWDAQSGQLRTKHLRKLLPRNAGIRG